MERIQTRWKSRLVQQICLDGDGLADTLVRIIEELQILAQFSDGDYARLLRFR